MFEAFSDTQTIVQNKEWLMHASAKALDIFFSPLGAIGTFILGFGYLVADNRRRPPMAASRATTPIAPVPIAPKGYAPVSTGTPLPDSISPEDQNHLVKSLHWSSPSELQLQILYGATDRCQHLAELFSAIVSRAKWTQPSPPSPVAPGSDVGKGIIIRSSLTDPAAIAANKLAVSLREIGLNPDYERTPELRRFSSCLLYIDE